MSDLLDNNVRKLNFIKIGDKSSKPTLPPVKKKYSPITSNDSDKLSPINNDANRVSKFDVQQTASIVSKKAMGMIPFTSNESNPNSFASIFNRDHQHVSGVKRVFKKSFSLMILSVLTGEAVLLLGISLFQTNPLNILICALAYSVFTNIFFIVLADRSYFWISLFAQLVLAITAYLFLGYGLNKISIAILFAICVLIYFAYSEIEKVQLSSRLFSISSVTSYATRILSTVIILFICLSVFNKASHDGTDVYFRDNFLNNSFIMNNAIIGNNAKLGNFSLNRFFAGTKYTIDGNSVKTYMKLPKDTTATLQNATLGDFLTLNYRPNEDLMSRSEKDDIEGDCRLKNDLNCDAKIEALKNDRLEKWKREAYPTISWSVQTELTVERYKELSKQFYTNQIRAFNNEKATSQSSEFTQTLTKYLFLPRNQILPTFLVVVIFLVLSIIKPLYNFLVFLCTLVIWQILKLTKFIRIDVETVEAEVVGI